MHLGQILRHTGGLEAAWVKLVVLEDAVRVEYVAHLYLIVRHERYDVG